VFFFLGVSPFEWKTPFEVLDWGTWCDKPSGIGCDTFGTWCNMEDLLETVDLPSEKINVQNRVSF
jgi:hypothetical protein